MFIIKAPSTGEIMDTFETIQEAQDNMFQAAIGFVLSRRMLNKFDDTFRIEYSVRAMTIYIGDTIDMPVVIEEVE